jgi:hypothetical protein
MLQAVYDSWQQYVVGPAQHVVGPVQQHQLQASARSAQARDKALRLPEVYRNFLSGLEAADLARATMACKDWNEPRVWRDAYHARWGDAAKAGIEDGRGQLDESAPTKLAYFMRAACEDWSRHAGHAAEFTLIREEWLRRAATMRQDAGRMDAVTNFGLTPRQAMDEVSVVASVSNCFTCRTIALGRLRAGGFASAQE